MFGFLNKYSNAQQVQNNVIPEFQSPQYQQQAYDGSNMEQCSPCSVPLRRIPTANSTEKPPCAVIVTIHEGNSYDNLFRANEQVSPNPEYSIALFEGTYECLENFIIQEGVDQSTFEGPYKDLKDAIEQVENDSVIFNFECCGGCSESFRNNDKVMSFANWVLNNRYSLMFGDFSARSLIRGWSTQFLGPNPFDIVGECSFAFDLHFDPETLKSCPSAQLQNVGRMCDVGHAKLHAMSGTVVFSLKPGAQVGSGTDTPYKIELLTVANNFTSAQFQHSPYRSVSIGKHEGTIGHVMLRYHERGTIIISAGHWVELNNLNANESSVMQAVGAQLGEMELNNFQAQLSSATSAQERDMYVQQNLRKVVLQSAPCNYSYKKG